MIVVATGLVRLGPIPDEIATLCILLDASFLCVATGVLLVQLFRTTEVDADMLVGSFCIYLLLGMIFAFAYLFLDATGDAFRYISEAEHGEGKSAFRDLMYYSYVTLTTLGYGDIVPISAPAKALAVFEAVCGQFYLAVLVARLLGLHIAAHRQRT